MADPLFKIVYVPSIQILQRVAPHWVIIQHFDCREHLPEQRLITAEKMLDMYAEKKLSRRYWYQ
jgi:hypothetical protein